MRRHPLSIVIVAVLAALAVIAAAAALRTSDDVDTVLSTEDARQHPPPARPGVGAGAEDPSTPDSPDTPDAPAAARAPQPVSEVVTDPEASPVRGRSAFVGSPAAVRSAPGRSSGGGTTSAAPPTAGPAVGQRPADPARPADRVRPQPSEPADPSGPTQVFEPAGSGDPPVPADPPLPEPPDVEACRELGRVAVGEPSPTEEDDGILAAGARFRALHPQLQERADEEHDGMLVCATPLRRWRNDLVTQAIFVGGQQVNRLVSGDRPEDPVLEISDYEWRAWDWHASGDSLNLNFAGIPLERDIVHGYQVIRTTNGAIVMERADTIGVAIVFGAWKYWERDGASMGAPATIPWGYGIGAEQAFDNGYLSLPDVTDPYQAAAREADDYLWLPLPENMVGPPAEPNTIIVFQGRSYYVGHDGLRHWIDTTGDYGCARTRLGASVRRDPHVSVVASAPLGARFACPS